MIAFKIAIWNANGLNRHNLEVTQFLNDHNIDIMLISETHFTHKSFLKIKNYSLYSTQHPAGTARGGTAVLVKKTLKHEVQEEFKTDFIQATSILVRDDQGQITISAIYSPPRHTIKKDQYDFFFKSLGSRFIVGGDFNAKHSLWGSRTINPKGRQLFNSIQANNLQHISTGEPTYWPSDLNKFPDVIDFCVTKGVPSQHCLAHSSLELSSDHSPIIVIINSKLSSSVCPAKLHNKKTNWNLFKYYVDEGMPTQIPLKCGADIDEAVEIFNFVIQTAGWSSTPSLTSSNRSYQTQHHIKDLIIEKRRLRKRWQETRHPETKKLLNIATKGLRKALEKQNTEETKQFLLKLTPTKTTNYSLWKHVKSTLNPTQRTPPIRSENGNWAKTSEEKVKLFAEHFSSVFNPFPSQNTSHDKTVMEYLESAGQLDVPIKKITLSEVKTIISKQNIKKSPGYDLITGKILKELPTSALTYLTSLFNGVLRLSYFPKQWKVAEVQVVAKPGKPLEDLKSYRPISLLPILSKIMEKLFLNRLQPLLTSTDLVPNHQFGFREKHSTIEQVHRVYNNLRNALENKEYCTAAFLDVTQAFDKVWHLGLLFKLKNLLPYPYFEFLRSYLSERSFRIKLNDCRSQLIPINAGVPQGSVLGPVLYTLFTADLPLSQSTSTATFADDTVIMSTDRDPYKASEKLQNHIQMLENWLCKWRIKVNATKSVQVTFTLNRQTCPAVTLNNIQLPLSESAKYLGIHLDRRLTWQKHIFTKRKQLGIKLTSLTSLIGKHSSMTLENKIHLYKAVIKPIWTYGIQLWGTAAKSNIAIIERFQSKTLRLISNAPRCVTNQIILRDLDIPTIQQEIENFGPKYHKRLEAHPNLLAAELAVINGTTRRLKKLIPADLF